MNSVSQLSILKGRICPQKCVPIHTLFEKVANSNVGKNVALIFEENGITRKLTYKELDNLTNKLARVISNTITTNSIPRNLDGDCIVAVAMSPSDYLIITLLAILKCGAAYLPLDHTFPKTRVEHILNEAKPAMVIYDNDSGHFLGSFKLSLDELLNAGKACVSSPLKDSERQNHLNTDLAIVMYTSGSTGIPKGVRLHNAMILNRLQWQFKTFPYSDTESTCVFKTSLTFGDSVAEIWGPLINGLSILVVPRGVPQNPEKLVQLLEMYKIERIVLVPSLLRTLLMYFKIHNKKQHLRQLKTWVCSGEALDASLARQFYQYFSSSQHKLCNFYGSTEITADVTFHVISNMDELKNQEKVPIGVPIDNTIIYLLDQDLFPVKLGEVGEIFVAGASVTSGYVNGRDSDKFIKNPLDMNAAFMKLYRTGDYGRIEEGKVLYEGRTDSQIKVRGYRVDLAEIDRSVNTIDGVKKSVTLCYKPGELNQTLLTFCKTNAFLNEKHIQKLLKENLPFYMLPQVFLLDEIPLLVNGKIDRQALLKLYDNSDIPNVEIDYTGVNKSQISNAKALFETVADVLSKSANVIHIHSNFYEIGGNSLNSIYTITRLKEKGYHISIGDFISATSLGEVLNRMSSDRQNLLPIVSSPRYLTEPLQQKHKEDALEMITNSFYQKADLDQWIITKLSEGDYSNLLDKIWMAAVEAGFSYIVKTKTEKFVGLSLNFDARDEPDMEVHSEISIILTLLEMLEAPFFVTHLPVEKNKTLHSYMMATDSTLTAKENVEVIQFMEEEVIRIAKHNNFEGIFTTNTNALTQQLCTDIYLYKTLVDYQVNQYVASDGTKPFRLAPDSQRILVQYKTV